MLIVVTGPIASGKSTVARALAQEFERRGVRAAVIDLDLVYEMLAPNKASKGDEEKWLLARRAAAVLADAFTDSGVEIVIVEGEFLTAQHRCAFMEPLQGNAPPRFVTLRVSFDSALQRVGNDPTRTLSRGVPAAALRGC